VVLAVVAVRVVQVHTHDVVDVVVVPHRLVATVGSVLVILGVVLAVMAGCAVG
jgi:hypothetical protein